MRRPRPRPGALRRALLPLACLSLMGVLAIPATAGAKTSRAVTASGNAAAAPTSSRPNIVFILTDDLDAASYDPARFPALRDLMATQGVTFNRFYVDDSLCCPSRASILRGQLVHNTDVLNNAPPEGGFAKFHAKGRERSTVATWLHAVGYRTGLFGKYLNGYPQTAPSRYVPPGWDDWVSPTAGNPYAEYDYELNENGALVRYGHQPNDYLVDVLSARAADFIRHSAGRQPFFAYVAPYVPHEPATPAPRYQNAFPGVIAPRTPSFDRPAQSSDPLWLRTRPALPPAVVTYTDQLYRRRLQDMLGVDDLLRNVVATLQQTGQLGNTYIFLGSDNGFHLGQHRLPPGKETAYEEDIRVPLWVRGPGVPRGTAVRRLAMNDDLAPTFAAIAEARVPGFVDGRSLLPLLRAHPSPSPWRDDVLVEHYGRLPLGAPVPGTTTPEPLTRFSPDSPRAPREPDNDNAFNEVAIRGTGHARLPQETSRVLAAAVDVPAYRALRTRRYLYVEYDDGARQLFDVRADPSEIDDIVDSVSHGTVQALSHRLHALERCRASGCRRLETAGGR